jgi:hypothetical protein
MSSLPSWKVRIILYQGFFSQRKQTVGQSGDTVCWADRVQRHFSSSDHPPGGCISLIRNVQRILHTSSDLKNDKRQNYEKYVLAEVGFTLRHDQECLFHKLRLFERLMFA